MGMLYCNYHAAVSPDDRVEMSDFRSRAEREAQIYDQHIMRRDQFEDALAYLNEGLGRIRRNEFIQAKMRDADGKAVLEIGSQAWAWCLHKHGYRPLRLVCINISDSELDIGRAEAAKSGIHAEFLRMDAHTLEFEPGSFDFIYGVAILHHL